MSVDQRVQPGRRPESQAVDQRGQPGGPGGKAKIGPQMRAQIGVKPVEGHHVDPADHQRGANAGNGKGGKRRRGFRPGFCRGGNMAPHQQRRRRRGPDRRQHQIDRPPAGKVGQHGGGRCAEHHAQRPAGQHLAQKAAGLPGWGRLGRKPVGGRQRHAGGQPGHRLCRPHPAQPRGQRGGQHRQRQHAQRQEQRPRQTDPVHLRSQRQRTDGRAAPEQRGCEHDRLGIGPRKAGRNRHRDRAERQRVGPDDGDRGGQKDKGRMTQGCAPVRMPEA